MTKELDEKNSDEGLFAPDGRKSSWQLAWPDMARELPILKSTARARLREEAEAKDKAEFEREKLRAQVEAARQGTNVAQETGMPGSRKRDLEFLEKELDRSQKKATYWEGEANYWKDRCLRCEKDLENHQAEREAMETMLTLKENKDETMPAAGAMAKKLDKLTKTPRKQAIQINQQYNVLKECKDVTNHNANLLKETWDAVDSNAISLEKTQDVVKYNFKSLKKLEKTNGPKV